MQSCMSQLSMPLLKLYELGFRNDQFSAMHACSWDGRISRRSRREGRIADFMESHGSVPGAVVCGLAYAALSINVNWSLRRNRSLPYAGLTLFCLCKLQLSIRECRSCYRCRLCCFLLCCILDVQIRFENRLIHTFAAVRVAAFACEAAAVKHPDRLRNSLFEGFYDGGVFLLSVVLYETFRRS